MCSDCLKWNCPNKIQHNCVKPQIIPHPTKYFLGLFLVLKKETPVIEDLWGKTINIYLKAKQTSEQKESGQYILFEIKLIQ